jgi:hypothetical protein
MLTDVTNSTLLVCINSAADNVYSSTFTIFFILLKIKKKLTPIVRERIIWIEKYAPIIPTYCINRLVFIIDKECVFLNVKTERILFRKFLMLGQSVWGVQWTGLNWGRLFSEWPILPCHMAYRTFRTHLYLNTSHTNTKSCWKLETFINVNVISDIGKHSTQHYTS